MHRVDWHIDAAVDLEEHDAWRISHGWEPMATEIIDAVEAAFARGTVFPRQRCWVKGELSPVYRTLVEVRSKRFLVYFLDAKPRPLIRRVLHPKRDSDRIEHG
ncbi:MAG: hypothetical protein ACM3XM_13720 [Mycobacterium leprae]